MTFIRIALPKDKPTVEIRAFNTVQEAEDFVQTPSDQLPRNHIWYIRYANTVEELKKHFQEFSDMDLYFNFVLKRGNELEYTRQATRARKYLENG